MKPRTKKQKRIVHEILRMLGALVTIGGIIWVTRDSSDEWIGLYVVLAAANVLGYLEGHHEAGAHDDEGRP